MAKFSRGDMVRILEYRDSVFVGFEGVVTNVHEPSGGEPAPSWKGGTRQHTTPALPITMCRSICSMRH